LQVAEGYGMNAREVTGGHDELADALGEAIGAAEPRARILLAQQAAFYESVHPTPVAALAEWRACLRRRSASYMDEVRDVAGVAHASDEDVPPDGGLEGYTGVALTALRALTTGRPETVVLNTANRGSVPFLDDLAVVEVPCRVDADGVRPLPRAVGDWTLHEQGLVSLVKDTERATIAAAERGSRELAIRALALHPLVASLEAAALVLDRSAAALGGLGAFAR
jgi:6-phospho-beta-glucosidase